MPPTLLAGWSVEQLEAHASIALDRGGRIVFASVEMNRLNGTPPLSMGDASRPPQRHPDPKIQAAIEQWRSFVLSGANGRLGLSSGRLDLPCWPEGTRPCRWEYFGIPSADPDYHLLIYEPIDEAAPEFAVRRALRMEGALFDIRSIVDDVVSAEPRREMPEPVDLAALTERELDVVKLLLDGRSNSAIARELHVSSETVKSHAKAIFKKLAVHSRAELLSRFVSGRPDTRPG